MTVGDPSDIEDDPSISVASPAKLSTTTRIRAFCRFVLWMCLFGTALGIPAYYSLKAKYRVAPLGLSVIAFTGVVILGSTIFVSVVGFGTRRRWRRARSSGT